MTDRRTRPEDRKIFGTGCHRTGTTSLNNALNILGFSSLHGAFELFDDPRHALLQEYDAFTDNPIPLLYKELDLSFPGSKFIHTIRPLEDWLKSVKWLFTVGPIKYRWDSEPVVGRIHLAFYGIDYFEPDVFGKRYLRHNAEVIEHFASRPTDLLMLDLGRDDCWSRLCAFLDKDIPTAPFPFCNRAVWKE
jgi:hypothetical protein